MLDLRRLRLLHELQRLGTVSAVADALSYSPSTVSQRLRVLEREAGTPLFEPAGPVAGVVRVGSFQTASLELLLPAMNALRESHPGVSVRLVEAEPEPALEALRSHALDLALADLADEAWATGYPGGGMAALVRRVCNEHGGFEPEIRHETNELTMLLALVAHGHAVTLLPA